MSNNSSALQLVNPNAESIRRAAALSINVNAAKGLQEVMRTNLGQFECEIQTLSLSLFHCVFVCL
jgi:hypothetical protein